MPVFVSLHLAEAEDGVLALPAVVVGLLAVVRAARRGAELGRGELLKAGRHDTVELLVLPPVRHHLVRVRAVVVALQTVEMARTLLIRACNDCQIQLGVTSHLFYVLMIILITTSFLSPFFPVQFIVCLNNHSTQ